MELNRTSSGRTVHTTDARSDWFRIENIHADRRNSLQSNIQIDENEIEIVEEFVYQGSLVMTDNNKNHEIQRRLISGRRAYYGLRKMLRSIQL